MLQTIEKPDPELKNVPLAIQYAKTEEGRALLDVANGAYSVAARPYSVPPGVPAERLALLQKAFMETLHDPELLKEAKKARLTIDPVDAQTIAKTMSSLYEMKPDKGPFEGAVTANPLPSGDEIRRRVAQAVGDS